MMKCIKILVLFFTLSACGQKTTEMKTPENTNEKFAEFIAKKKFVEENYYPGISDEKMRPIFVCLWRRCRTHFCKKKKTCCGCSGKAET